MTQIKQHTLQSGERILLVSVPSFVKHAGIALTKNSTFRLLVSDDTVSKVESYSIPQDVNWQLIGLSDEITEEQAKTIAREIYTPNDVPNQYENYTGDYFLNTALESFKSLMQSLGCEGRYAVLRKKI